MGKAADAFRTISEVADWLEVPAHVLRFWESKFTQIKPVKRAGGRRYYRPADMALLGGIKVLLHDQGMTIKGAQKYLRENGIQQVSDMSPPLDEEAQGALSGIALDVPSVPARPADVLAFTRPDGADDPAADPEDTAEVAVEPEALEDGAYAADAEAPLSPQTKAPAPKEDLDAPALPPIADQTPHEAASAAPELSETAPSFHTAPEPEPEGDTAAGAEDETPPLEPDASPTQTAPHPRASSDLPADPSDDVAAAPGLLTALSALPRPVSPQLAARLAPLVAALQTHAASGTKDR
ncbi:MerR HTH family regulatory protein [Roseovarius sp. EC-HK134]|uniref:MerR family transcriptional regulator n=1 Tax=unclassified Roseovarius TaxID=2614913 RepID=UPI001258FC4E|nr:MULTISPECIES: MerR family transcriptional regulator [unclassified Roseovarius]VVT29844.1 MerR HTH family regulatory protein [Roseovarius sp. EC-HK134]VVT31124.1 MerR HTH family regulatory protein [Roseovarius sp. EC-SD190]